MSLSVFLVLYLAFFLVMEHLVYTDVVCRTSMEQQLLGLGSRPKQGAESKAALCFKDTPLCLAREPYSCWYYTFLCENFQAFILLKCLILEFLISILSFNDTKVCRRLLPNRCICWNLIGY